VAIGSAWVARIDSYAYGSHDSWSGWRSALLIVKPETVIAWHRKGFRLYWKWKSRHPEGRPSVSLEVIDLIHRMSLANPGWGAPRIHGELLKLGFELSQATVANYLVRRRRPPSQNWRTFLNNHVQSLASADFFVVPTITFRLLFVFVILSHDRRRPIHLAVTANPTAEWTTRQLLEAFPWDSAPRYLLRDRRVHSLGAGVALQSKPMDGTNRSPAPPRHRFARTNPLGRYAQVHGRLQFACGSQAIQEPLLEI
jgi:hypothetical protein